MRLLVLFFIGVVAGAFCTAAALGSLAKRGAHMRASMIMLAHHTDALRAASGRSDCVDERVIRHWNQLGFGAAEIEHAFAHQVADSSQFRRRSDQLQATLAQPANDERTCADLPQQLSRVEQACQACHREFR